MNLLNSSQRNYRFHAVSRRSKFTAAAAYENHAAWRRSAAADNTDLTKKCQISEKLVEVSGKYATIRRVLGSPQGVLSIRRPRSKDGKYGNPTSAREWKYRELFSSFHKFATTTNG